jgi:arginase family enzyme
VSIRIPATYPVAPAGRFATTIRVVPEWSPDQGGLDQFTSGCRVAIIGLADDTGVKLNNGRAGAAQGPDAFRGALSRYGLAELMDFGTGRPMSLPAVADLGNIIPGDTLAQTHDRVTAVASAACKAGLIPVGIGGGHDLTFPLVRATVSHAGVRRGVYVDPHLDVRETDGSGMPFRALIDRCGIECLVNVGAEPLVNSVTHTSWFLSHGGIITQDLSPLKALVQAGNGPKFVSLDLDALDASAAPGVSALNPNGLSVREMAAFATAAGLDASVACFDLMELNPVHDEQGRTARVAVHLFFRFLQGLARR